MKSILFICDLGHCPHRMPGWADGLAEIGWKVFVISPKMTSKQRQYFGIAQKTSWTLIESNHYPMVYKRYTWLSSKLQAIYSRWHTRRYRGQEHSGLREILRENELSDFSRVIERLSHLAWYPSASKQAIKAIKNHEIDLIISSSSPFLAHLIARSASLRTGVPWVPDYRDLWSMNHTKNIVSREEVLFESYILEHAVAAITATAGMSAILEKVFSGEIWTTNNAFTDSPIQIKGRESNETLRIVYTGTVYRQHQNLTPILEALRIINRNNIVYELHIYGFGSQDFLNWHREQNYLVPKYIEFHNHMSLPESRIRQQEADLLLFLDWEENFGWESTKLIEYLPHFAFIIGTGNFQDSRAAEILRLSGRGAYFTNLDDLVTFLRYYPTEVGANLARRNEDFVQTFSMRSQVYNLQSKILPFV